MNKVGDRVLAIIGAKNGKVQSLGEGVYAGDFVPPDNIPTMFKWPNPRIDLDNGKSVWGCECWWGSVDKVKRNIPADWKWETIDIDDYRKQYDEEH